jgi:hypothetical protein
VKEVKAKAFQSFGLKKKKGKKKRASFLSKTCNSKEYGSRKWGRGMERRGMIRNWNKREQKVVKTRKKFKGL